MIFFNKKIQSRMDKLILRSSDHDYECDMKTANLLGLFPNEGENILKINSDYIVNDFRSKIFPDEYVYVCTDDHVKILAEYVNRCKDDDKYDYPIDLMSSEQPNINNINVKDLAIFFQYLHDKTNHLDINNIPDDEIHMIYHTHLYNLSKIADKFDINIINNILLYLIKYFAIDMDFRKISEEYNAPIYIELYNTQGEQAQAQTNNNT